MVRNHFGNKSEDGRGILKSGDMNWI